MNKVDFISAVARRIGMRTKDVDEVLKAVAEVIVEQVRDEGEQIVIGGLGTFKQKLSEARKGRNPLTGEEIQVKASRNIQFRPQSSVKVTIEDKPAKPKKKK